MPAEHVGSEDQMDTNNSDSEDVDDEEEEDKEESDGYDSPAMVCVTTCTFGPIICSTITNRLLYLCRPRMFLISPYMSPVSLIQFIL